MDSNLINAILLALSNINKKNKKKISKKRIGGNQLVFENIKNLLKDIITLPEFIIPTLLIYLQQLINYKLNNKKKIKKGGSLTKLITNIHHILQPYKENLIT